MNDQRIKCGSLFCLEYFCHDFRIERITCEAVDGFRRKGNKASFIENFDCCSNGFEEIRSGIENRRTHAETLLRRAHSWPRNSMSFPRNVALCRARILTADKAAFFAPASPIASVGTGMPAGI